MSERDRIIHEVTASTGPITPLQVRAAKRFGRWLKRARLDRDLMLHEAAVRCGMRASRMFALEECTPIPLVQSEEVIKIARGFKVSMEEAERAAWGWLMPKEKTK